MIGGGRPRWIKDKLEKVELDLNDNSIWMIIKMGNLLKEKIK